MTLRLISLNTGQRTPVDGQYVVDYDPKRPPVPGSGMSCYLVTTPHEHEARQFADAGEALTYWKQENGMRPDGRPNRPLTAFNVEVQWK